jgi:hemerythrin superfamily protein
MSLLGTGLSVTATRFTAEDVIDVLLEDHREFEGLLGRLTSGRDGDLAGVLTATLVRHAIAEEEYVYPTVRDHVTGGDRIADRGMAQHAQIAETMHQLDTTGRTDSERQRLIAALGSEVRRHIRHDRMELFPRLRVACTRSHLAWLGERVAGMRHAGRHASRAGSRRVVEPGGLIEQVRSALAERWTRNTE